MNKFPKIPIIGVMGPGSSATEGEIEIAYALGRMIAAEGWAVLTGGVNTGVMNAALKGAKERDSKCLTIGILPHRGDPEHTSEYLDIAIPTGMGEGRNNLNILTSHFIISCCNRLTTSPGTLSEVVFAIKHKKPLIGLHGVEDNDYYKNGYLDFFNSFGEQYRHDKQKVTSEPADVIRYLKDWVKWVH
jgi:uncharacterized protein (TIGR00725 family)